jgi:Tol biopolymer transport system component
VIEAMRKRSTIEAGRRERLALAITPACSVALSGGVIASLIYLLLALASLMAARPAFAQTAPVGAGVRLEAGIEKEDVDGDLKSAMDIYQKIAADTSAPRDVRAKALLRLAGCDEKLGKQAKQVYEQIVRDYADQPPAAQARKRLALLNQQEHPALPTTMSLRKIETSSLGEMSPSDTDGQRAVYRAKDGNLYFGDLAGHTRHLVFKVQPGDVPGWCPSRDMSLTALGFEATSNRPGTLAVVKTDGTAYRELIHDDSQGTLLGGGEGFSKRWSWDARHLLVWALLPNGGAHLMTVDVADGRHRELVSLQSGIISHAAFSPDGHYIAYLTWPATGSGVAMRIFVMPTEGGEPRQVYESSLKDASEEGPNARQRLYDWTADGRYLVFSDIHFQKEALYLLPLKNGTVAGNPVFVREGAIEAAQATASGALVLKDQPTHANNVNTFQASLDPEGKLGAWHLLEIRGNGGWNPGLSFSPDGTQIAYISGDEERGGWDLVLRDLATSEERNLYWFNSGLPFCNFAYDEPKVFCVIGWKEGGGRSELVSVTAKTGALEKLGSFNEYRGEPTPSRDGQHLYFWSVNALGDVHLVRWEMSSRQDTLIDTLTKEEVQDDAPTPDERWLVRADNRGLAIRPMSGGDWRFLVPAAAGVLAEPDDATPRDDSVLFDAKDSEGKLRLYRIPISGGEPQLLGDFPGNSKPGSAINDLRLSRDGRKVIAVSLDDSKYDLWELDNFEPPVKK